MILTLEDGLGKGKSVFGRIAGTMVGIPPVRKSDFQKKKKSTSAPGMQITPQMVKEFNKRGGAKAFRKKKAACRCIKPGAKKKVIYNSRTKEAYIVPMNDSGLGNVLTTALTSNPYGAAIKGGFDIVKGVFGGKKKKTASSGAAAPAAPAVPMIELSKVQDAVTKFQARQKESQDKIKKLESENASLSKQRYYTGGGGFVLGAALGYALKR